MRRSLGRYELTHELGRGGMGVVWAAHDRDHHREVAVKVLAPLGRGADLSTRRFLREIRLTSRLRHPGVPTVHDHGSHEGELYLMMDLVPGRALDAVLLTTTRAGMRCQDSTAMPPVHSEALSVSTSTLLRNSFRRRVGS